MKEPDKYDRLIKLVDEHNFVVCSACLKPCFIVHDLDMSECCHAPLIKGRRRNASEGI